MRGGVCILSGRLRERKDGGENFDYIHLLFLLLHGRRSVSGLCLFCSGDIGLEYLASSVHVSVFFSS